MPGAAVCRSQGALMACLLVAIVTLSSLAAPVVADQDPPTDDNGPQTVDPQAHPLFRSLPAPPQSIRLWAQMSGSGDAFMTLQRDVLPGPFTAAPMQPAPQLTFQLFSDVQTLREEDQLFYRGDEVRAAWDTGFLEDVPVQGRFVVSTSMRDVDTAAPMAPMRFTVELKAEDHAGFRRSLASDSVQVDANLRTKPFEIPFDLGAVTKSLREGERLLLEFSWGWVQGPGVGTVRQPAVSVHAGSWLDVPLEEPVRVLELKDRVVADNVYLQARVGHVFTREYLSERGTQLVVNGPGLQTTGGRALVTAGANGPGDTHNLTFDWAIPIEGRTLRGSDYDLYVTLAHKGEDGPRVVAHRPIHVPSVLPLSDVSAPTMLLGLLGTIAVLGIAGFTWRRGRN